MIYGLVLFGIAIYALNGAIAKFTLQSVSSFLFMAFTMYIGATCALFASIFLESQNEKSIMMTFAENWKLLCLYGLVNFMAFFIYMYSIKLIPLSHYQLISVMSPIFGGIFAYFLLGEGFTRNFFLALPFFVIGIFIIVYQK